MGTSSNPGSPASHPAYGLWMQSRMAQSLMTLHPCERPDRNSWILASEWCSSNRCCHLGSESLDRRSSSLCLSSSLYIWVCYKNKINLFLKIYFYYFFLLERLPSLWHSDSWSPHYLLALRLPADRVWGQVAPEHGPRMSVFLTLCSQFGWDSKDVHSKVLCITNMFF